MSAPKKFPEEAEGAESKEVNSWIGAKSLEAFVKPGLDRSQPRTWW